MIEEKENEELMMADQTGILKKELRESKTLTKEDEISLAKRAKEGDNKARDALIVSQMPLVIKMAKEYFIDGCELEDRVSFGTIGLIAAVDNFDYEKGFRLSTFAKPYIKKEILRQGYDNANPIKIPEEVRLEIRSMRNVEKALSESLGREPTDAETAAQMNVTEKRVAELKEYDNYRYAADLDSKVGDDEDGDLLVDTVKDENALIDNDIDKAAFRLQIVKELDGLKTRDREIVEKASGFRRDNLANTDEPLKEYKKLTLEEIGREYGITKQAVSRIILNFRKKR